MRQGLADKHGHGQLLLLLLTPVVLWSTVFPFSKLVLTVLPPATLAAIRFSTGALVLLLYAARNYGWRHLLQVLRLQWFTFLLLGSIGIFLNNFLQNLGLRLSTASSTSLLSSCDPIFSTILSAMFLREALTRRKLGGLLLAAAGVYLVTTNGRWLTDWGNSAGNLLVIASALCYSVYTILSKRILHLVEPPVVVAWSTMFGAVLLAASAALLDPAPDLASLTGGQWLAAAYLSIIPTSVSVLAYFYLLQQLQASEAAITIFLVPVFSILWSTWLLHERLTLAMLVGGGLIIAGVALSISARRSATSSASGTD